MHIGVSRMRGAPALFCSREIASRKAEHANILQLALPIIRTFSLAASEHQGSWHRVPCSSELRKQKSRFEFGISPDLQAENARNSRLRISLCAVREIQGPACPEGQPYADENDSPVHVRGDNLQFGFVSLPGLLACSRCGP